MLIAILLGIVQGLTEFLPVSSSGHLVVLQQLLGFRQPGISFEVAVHFGTLLAILVVYLEDLYKMTRAFLGGLRALWHREASWQDFWRDPYARLAALLVIGSMPTAVIALSLEGFFLRFYESVTAVGVFWLVTGFVLWGVNRLGTAGRDMEGIRPANAVFVGILQGAAIAPGLSRSGLTVAGGLLTGLGHRSAANFSFLLSVPAVLGAVILDLPAVLGDGAGASFPVLFWGSLAAAVSGYLAIKFFLRMIAAGQLIFFAFYCWLVGLLALGWMGWQQLGF